MSTLYSLYSQITSSLLPTFLSSLSRGWHNESSSPPDFVNNSEMHSPATSTELTPETSEISAVWKEAWLKVQSNHQHSNINASQVLSTRLPHERRT